MANKEKDHEFDPEKHKDIKKGPLKPEHKNQYGNSEEQKEEDEPKRVIPNKKGENEG